jgi:hypothetical protein
VIGADHGETMAADSGDESSDPEEPPSTCARASQRGVSDFGVILILLGAAVLLVMLVVFQAREREVCEQKGGTFYCGYKSTCVCFARGTVLP